MTRSMRLRSRIRQGIFRVTRVIQKPFAHWEYEQCKKCDTWMERRYIWHSVFTMTSPHEFVCINCIREQCIEHKKKWGYKAPEEWRLEKLDKRRKKKGNEHI